MSNESQIIRTEYSDLMKKSYIDYAMSVIIARALPDVRDGLKPVQRRTLYDMYELGIRYDKPYRKSARIVGDTMGKYHPHGDSSIYDSLVVMAQDFKKGQVLVDGHGNFGSIEGDGAAAMRYTEARLTKFTQEVCLADLDKNVIDFGPNFDETEKEPLVLPMRVPNLLINGAEGIAVGMATSIPTHNLCEVVDAVKAYMKNDKITTKQLMKYIKGPDFPTGGIVVNKDDLPAIYESGQGKIKLRGKVEVEELKGGKKQLVITEIPYTMIGAGIGKFLNDVCNLVESKKTTDIVDISNQSSKEGIRIVIELKRGADVENLKNMLYKKTRLEDTFGVNMLAVANGRPETLSLKQIIEHHVDFQFELATRKYTTLLGKEREKSEVQEGLIKACDVIDLIIEILRGSKSVKDARACLVNGETENIKFKSAISKKMAAMLRFTERQATAILEMRLYRLIGLEIEALQKEHEKTLENIARYEDILNNYDSMAGVIMEELDSYKKEFGRKRRTVVENAEEALEFIEKTKKKYWDARHNCFAYVIGERGQLQRCSDDGEPNGTAGKPMLDVLLGNELRNVAVVVTRYFGGTLLGTGGLVRAYSQAVKAGLQASVVITKILGVKLHIETDYTTFGKIQYILAQRELKILDTVYTDKVELEVLIPKTELEQVMHAITEGTNAQADMTPKEECYYAEIDGVPTVLE